MPTKPQVLEKEVDQRELDAMAEAVARFKDDPYGFVLFIFPWGEKGTRLESEDGPDVWQRRVLVSVGKELQRRRTEPDALAAALRVAVASGHGVGKTALVAWVILWFMATRWMPQIVVTANTRNQLTAKTWRELAKWHRLCRIPEWFQWTATKFYAVWDPATHFAMAVPWSKENSEAFAGTHEENVLILMDEASAVDDGIWEVAEGAMTTNGAMWFAFGNPTRNTGRFRECWRKFRHRWMTLRVDSREAKKANRAQLDQWIEDYGEDSDFVRVRIKGEFPRAASNQFIGQDLIDAARARKVDTDPFQPIVIGVDVARFGDDQSVIVVRQGWKIHEIRRYRELDNVQLGYRVIEAIHEWHPAAVFIDESGTSCFDIVVHLGFDPIGVNGGRKADEDAKYFNKRAEMWAEMREWLKRGGCLPNDEELELDLMSPEYGFDSRHRVQLEKKDDMKARGMPSPDTGDALAHTFYQRVAMQIAESSTARKLREVGRVPVHLMKNWEFL